MRDYILEILIYMEQINEGSFCFSYMLIIKVATNDGAFSKYHTLC